MFGRSFRILHLTDTHILREPGARLYGVDSYGALESLLGIVEGETWKPHCVVATGDLSQDGSPESYQRLRRLLVTLDLPVYCVPGNHDDPSNMHTHLKGGLIRIKRAADLGSWRVVFLDSQVAGEEHGLLGASELADLENALGQASGRPTLVALHHGPFPVCPLPECRLENAEAFLGILSRHPQVRAVISGHNHCELDRQYGHLRLLVTPSTFLYADHPSASEITQPSQRAHSHQFDPRRRGARRIDLYPDGQIDTRAIWNNVQQAE